MYENVVCWETHPHGYLLDNEEDPDPREDDDEEREEESGRKEIHVVRIVRRVSPAGSTAHPVILDGKCPPAKKGRKSHQKTPNPGHNHQEDGNLAAVPGKASLEWQKRSTLCKSDWTNL